MSGSDKGRQYKSTLGIISALHKSKRIFNSDIYFKNEDYEKGELLHPNALSAAVRDDHLSTETACKALKHFTGGLVYFDKRVPNLSNNTVSVLQQKMAINGQRGGNSHGM